MTLWPAPLAYTIATICSAIDQVVPAPSATHLPRPVPAPTLVLLEYSFLSSSQSPLCALNLHRSLVYTPRILGSDQPMQEDWVNKTGLVPGFGSVYRSLLGLSYITDSFGTFIRTLLNTCCAQNPTLECRVALEISTASQASNPEPLEGLEKGLLVELTIHVKIHV